MWIRFHKKRRGTVFSFKDYVSKRIIEEGNELQQRFHKHISRGIGIGAVSPEGDHTKTEEEIDAAHAMIRSDLESARKSGHIGGWSGPHKGQYRYDKGEGDIAHEKSYLAHAKSDSDEHHDQMVDKLKEIGNKHNQETILVVNPKNKKGHWHYLKNSWDKKKKKSKDGEKAYQGKVVYNRPLKQSTGNTQIKDTKHSFTTIKEKK